MTEKRTLRQVIDEARAEIKQWPAAMRELNEFRRDEIRKLDQAQASDTDRPSCER